MIKNKNRRKKTIIIIALCAILIILLGVILLSYAANESSMKYKKVIDELVRDYYPELAGKKIVVFERPFLGKGSATAFPFPPTITVSTRVRNYLSPFWHTSIISVSFENGKPKYRAVKGPKEQIVAP